MQGLTPDEEQALLLSVGTHRKDRKLSPFEVAQLLRKATTAGTTRQDCAHLLQIGPTQISEFINLLKLSPEISHLADWGSASQSTIPFSSLAQLAGLPNPDEHLRATQAILAHRLTWKEVVQLVQLRRRSTESIDESINAIIKLRTQIETKHVYIGSISSERTIRALASQLQQQRDALFSRVIDEIPNLGQGFVGRLGTNRFTVVGNFDPAETAGLSPDELENLINKYIEKHFQQR